MYKSHREAATPLNEIDIIICIINNYDCVSVRLGSGWFFELESASESASESDTVWQRVGVGAWATGAAHRALSSLSSLICTASERCWCRAAN